MYEMLNPSKIQRNGDKIIKQKFSPVSGGKVTNALDVRSTWSPDINMDPILLAVLDSIFDFNALWSLPVFAVTYAHKCGLMKSRDK